MAQLAQAKLEFIEEFIGLSRLAIAEAVRPEVDADKADDLAERITTAFLAIWGWLQRLSTPCRVSGTSAPQSCHC